MKLFNQHYIYTVQITSGKKFTSLGGPSNPERDEIMVDEIIEKYKNHLTLLAIKDSFHAEKLSDLLKANAEDINKIIKSLNTCLHFCKFS